jgi:tetratricopeptide (TPR) repeat protein
MDDAEIEEASVTVWTCALDQLDTALGPFHYTSLRSRTEFIQMAEVKKGMDVAESSLRRLLDGCKTRLGMADARTLKLLDTLAELVLGHGNYQLADELADDLIACAPLATPWSRSIDIWVAGLFVKARVQKQLGQTEMALATLQEAIDLNVSQWGWSYALTLKYLVYQETWLVEISEHERASEVKRLRIGALELSEKKS